MIDLLIEYRHWLAGTVMGVGFVGLFIRQEVARKRRLRRMRCRMLARHCGTRESCFRGGRCPKAPRGARPVQTERASMPMYYANPDC